MDKINEYLKRTRIVETGSNGFECEGVRPRLICKDGFSVSVQASRFHYCSPQIDGANEYEAVELGFPSAEDSIIEEYAEDPTDLTGTVYGYVPVDIVNKLVEKHGGIEE